MINQSGLCAYTKIKKKLQHHTSTPSPIIEHTATDAAVLIPLFNHQSQCHLRLIQRTTTVSKHKGQIAFPGGKVDSEDTDHIMTALRETEEEIGIESNRVEVLGVLERHLTATTGFLITPVVGFIAKPEPVRLAETEVAELINVPLSFFLNQHPEKETIKKGEKILGDSWVYRYQGRKIWGATARIILQFCSILLK
ncbi:NUDIX hydrolase [Magnetococcales bacterium HHB-1]